MCFLTTINLNSHGVPSFDAHSSVGWHNKCEWDFIYTGDLGQLKVVFLRLITLRIKFQNLILIGFWKFGGHFHPCSHAQIFSLHKVEIPLSVPEKSSMLFSRAILLPTSCVTLVETDPSATLLQNSGLHLLLHLWPLWRFPHIAFCLGI